MNWKAIYNDGSELDQFKDGKENLFKDIDEDRLVYFKLSDGRNTILLNVPEGKFILNNQDISIDGYNNEQEENRLIYFRRVIRSLGQGGVIPATSVVSYIGYQYNDEKGENKKVMLCYKEGEFKFFIDKNV
jgi:hypothetical protein